MKRVLLLLILLLLPSQLLALDFTLHQKQGKKPGPTLLVVGGIQGDEPGGFNAAALLATRYRVTQGNLWVVPNLNFPSIIKRTRGLHGDMNRKFDSLPKSDPEYHQISRIKSIITDPQVDLVFNLHDGSGFYRPEYIDRLHNPDRWGQSCIIDQGQLPGTPFGNLEEFTRKTVTQINAKVLDPDHRFRLKNTSTRWEETDQKQSLTYFAVRSNKPAFGIEASKNFPTHIRVYYHLLAMEAYMKQTGLEFLRDFDLTPDGVKQALKKDVRISFGDGRIQLELKDLRPTLKYFPLPKDTSVRFSSNNPLVALIPYRSRYRIHYGNNRLAFLKPQFFDYDESLNGVEMLVDGVSRQVEFGSTIPVDREFMVRSKQGYRVNVIGYFHKGKKDESNILVQKKQIRDHYSVDKMGQLFRVEVYRKNRFSGMILVDFRQQANKQGPLVAQATHSEKTTRPLNN